MHFLKYISYVFSLTLAVVLLGCASAYTETGKASYYNSKLSGKKMANGDNYRPGKLTAAHKTLPFGTKLKVTNLKTGKSVKVKVTDRGPFSAERVVDLSYKAAKKVDLVQAGVAPVKIKVVGKKRS